MLDRRIDLLRAVVRWGTVTEAGQVLHRSPSGISRQLQDLQRELGVVLLEHVGRRVRPTTAAEQVVAYAEETAASWERVRASLAEQEEAGGRLRVCAHASALAALVAPSLGQARARFPRLRVEVTEAAPAESYRLLLADRADLAVTVVEEGIPPWDDPAHTQWELVREPVDALVPSGHPFAGRSAVGVGEMSGGPWIVPPPSLAGHHEIMAICHAAGFTPDVAHHVQEWGAATALVSADEGVTLISRLVHPPEGTTARRVPLEPAPGRQLLLATRAGAAGGASVAAFERVLRERIEQVMGPT